MTTWGLLIHQLRDEQRAFWRNPEAAFFTFALPIGLVLMFGSISRDDRVPGRPGLNALVLIIPGFLAFGLIIAAYGNLAATVASLRTDGALKRIRATPLSPAIYLGGHLANVLAVASTMTVTTVVLGGLVFDTFPPPRNLALLVGAVLLGVTCFAALGLALTAVIPTADSAGAITNGTYVPLAIISGTFSYDLVLPAWLDRGVSVFPVKAFTTALRAGYDPGATAAPWGSLLVLAVWAVAGTFLAVRTFRWNP